MGLFATALATGGVVGPLLSGFLVQHLGFRITFYAFAGLAALGAVLFTLSVPETRPQRQQTEPTPQGPEPAFSGA
jgi:predicted MFS family arabinose efflux permease